MPGLVSAAGVIGYLAEPEPEIKAWALQQLHHDVDLLWPEIADSVGDM
jgi:26S proteasome regulatory subunit N2